jgi:hypothetical protein
MSPIDARRMALTPDGRTAERLADIERQVRIQQRISPAATNDRAVSWQTPTLVNSFSNWGSGYAPVAYYMDSVGRVYLRGAVQRPSNTQPLTIFTLDVGYRPLYQHDFQVPTWLASVLDTGAISVLASGAVQLFGGFQGTGARFVLDSISFRTL